MAHRFATPFEGFVTPARRRPQLWRLCLGLIVCVAVYLAGVAAIFGTIWLTAGKAAMRGWLVAVAMPSTPAATLFLLGTFLGMALGPMLVARLLHRRPLASLFGHLAIVIRHFVLCVGVTAPVYATALTVWFAIFGASPRTGLTDWLVLLPVALAGVLLQTGAEELVFRGYLQQQLAARFRSPLVWMVLPAALFATLHYDPSTSGGNVLPVLAATGFFGLAAADLTRATGSLGAAWGLHFTNNVVALLIVATNGTITGLSLYSTPYTAADPGPMRAVLLADMAVLAVNWSLVRLVFRR